MKEIDLEQASRLHSGHTAHKLILDKIKSGSDIIEIRRYCSQMMRAAEKQLESLLKSENEVVVSDACTQHVDLPRVGKRNESGEVAQSPIASEHGALENRISDEKSFKVIPINAFDKADYLRNSVKRIRDQDD